MITELRARLGDELERLSTGRVGDRATVGRLVAGLAQVDASEIWLDRAGFGSVVRVRDSANGAENVFTLMTGDLVDPDEGHVSLASPIGYALLGRAAGDRVTVATPRGERRFEILSVDTLPSRVGLAGDAALAPAEVGARVA